MQRKVSLVLSNGEIFEGEAIGASAQSSGEMVFTTAMVGYCEALTDPSYFGQILVFSYPLIGNYGVPPIPSKLSLPIPRGIESSKIHASAVVITVDSPEAYHWKSFQSLDSWLCQQNVPGIIGLDTRHLVQKIRSSAGLLGRVDFPPGTEKTRLLGELDPMDLATNKGKAFFDPALHNVVSQVSVKKTVVLGGSGKNSRRIGILDFGVKWNIVRQLIALGCEVEIFPWDTPTSEMDCSGYLLSNGPGDPAMTGDAKDRVIELMRRDQPILGICLGHQVLCHAVGLTTEKMKFGHRSHNQPVYEVGTRRGAITSQNHGYMVVDAKIPDDWSIWFRNANDQSVEGIRHKAKPFCSVQFHPESAAGPRDTGYILKNFVSEVNGL